MCQSMGILVRNEITQEYLHTATKANVENIWYNFLLSTSKISKYFLFLTK